ncbi:YbaB/EbfC family nucleoid-associated protein [Saccharothrix obliqua]|uniref:YbaB/EbfC family nucleoid-associated protein n=1 Tax=Saccharothrix obliqua TaxID=2861747 RepID=UPI001C5D9194|nr:YbaB/EbfC family nucleoid-associated protein [Saccharothrix obliqua]MBW4716132.1 YbaB/EbfC family nucleoid-associated protein [Saccharothrix obliqua]
MSAQEERIAAADRLAEVLARVTGTATHPSGLVTVTASAVGALRSVRLRPEALGRGAEALGQAVAETARLATDAAVQTSYNELAKTLGDSMAMAIEDFAGPPPLRARVEDGAGSGATGHAGGGWGDEAATGPRGGARHGEAGRGEPPGEMRQWGGARPAPWRPAAEQPGAPGRYAPGGVPLGPGTPGQGGPWQGAPWQGNSGQGNSGQGGPGQGAPGYGGPQPGGSGRSAGGTAGSRRGGAGSRAVPPGDDEDDDDFFADPFRGQRR